MRGLACVVLAIALLFLASCGQSKNTGRVDAGGRINVTHEHGKAVHWGVSFEVFETGPGGAGVEGRGGTQSEENLIEGACRLTFGEVLVDLAKLSKGSIVMEINGKNFGSVVAEDKVVIAADRTVTVNGEARQPE